MKKILVTFALILSFNFSVNTFCCAQKLVNATIVTRGRDTIQCLIHKPDKKAKFIEQVVTYDRQGHPLTTYTPHDAYCFTVNNNYYMHGTRPDSNTQCFINMGPPIQQVIKENTEGLEIYLLRIDWAREMESPEEMEQYEKKKRQLAKRHFCSDYDTTNSYVIDDNKKVEQFTKGFTGTPVYEILFCGYDLCIFIVRDGKILDCLQVNTECKFISSMKGNYFYNALPIEIIDTSKHASFATFEDDDLTGVFYADLKEIKGLMSGTGAYGLTTTFSKNTEQFNKVLKKYIK